MVKYNDNYDDNNIILMIVKMMVIIIIHFNLNTNNINHNPYLHDTGKYLRHKIKT